MAILESNTLWNQVEKSYSFAFYVLLLTYWRMKEVQGQNAFSKNLYEISI